MQASNIHILHSNYVFMCSFVKSLGKINELSEKDGGEEAIKIEIISNIYRQHFEIQFFPVFVLLSINKRRFLDT